MSLDALLGRYRLEYLNASHSSPSLGVFAELRLSQSWTEWQTRRDNGGSILFLSGLASLVVVVVDASPII